MLAATTAAHKPLIFLVLTIKFIPGHRNPPPIVWASTGQQSKSSLIAVSLLKPALTELQVMGFEEGVQP